MNIRRFLFLYPALLLFPFSEILANHTAPLSENSCLLPTECNLPAPTNFHTEFIGPDKVLVAWDQPQVNPFEYNLKVYLSGGILPVQDITIPGNKVFHLVDNLTPNKKYLFVLTPICEGGKEGKSASLEILTIITELVVIGFNPATNSELPACSIPNATMSCSLNLNPSKFGTFRIEKTGSMDQYSFGVYRGEGCPAIEVLMLSTNNQGKKGNYYMLCNQPSDILPPNCTGNSFSIFSNSNNTSNKIAEIEIATGSDYVVFLRCTMLAPGYSISRMGSVNGQTAPFQGCAGLIDDQQDERFNGDISRTSTDQSLSVHPNPFTDLIEIHLPLSAQKENTDISVFSLQGRCVMTEHFPGNQPVINLITASLAPGMYFLRAESNGITRTVKIVKTQ